MRITPGNLEKYLGVKKYQYDTINEKDSWNCKGTCMDPVGGDTLSIEVNIMEGSGKLELTGQLGDVMKIR